MSKLLILTAALLLAATLAQAQTLRQNKYWVEFTDKIGTPFCTCRPAEFLSARSLERRAKAGIAVTEEDLPVNPAYLEALKSKNAKIHHSSRWLNAATVQADSATAASLRDLPFVKKVEYIGRHLGPRHKPNLPLKKRAPLGQMPSAEGGDPTLGYAALQNSLLGMPALYHAGVRGAGIWVVVMDGGFTNVDTIPLFDSIGLQNRLFSGWDFVERDRYVFEASGHGTSVLSVMAANLPGYFVGTGPDATYFCVKTEDTGGEFPVEEANWIAGAEWADSLGADIVNASLGYTTFNDTTLNHKYLTLDGRTAIGSRGATIAARKGMIVFNSAGNSGDEAWHYIGVPSDAPGIIAVGATDYEGAQASFSSFGPTADGRIKPDLAAPGEMIVTASGSGYNLGFSSGTSVASPMLAGATASLWSAYPDKTAPEILDAIFQSANQREKPDEKLGYGLPEMGYAWLRLGGFLTEKGLNNGRTGWFSFSRDRGELAFIVPSDAFSQKSHFELRDFLGRKIQTTSVEIADYRLSKISFSGLEHLPPGAYQAIFHNENGEIRRTLGLAF